MVLDKFWAKGEYAKPGIRESRIIYWYNTDKQWQKQLDKLGGLDLWLNEIRNWEQYQF